MMKKNIGDINVDANTILILSAFGFLWYWWNNHSLNPGGTGEGTPGDSTTGRGNSKGDTSQQQTNTNNPSSGSSFSPSLNLGVPGLTSGGLYQIGKTLTDANGSLTVAPAPKGTYTVIDQTSAPTAANSLSDAFQVYSFVGTKVYDQNGNLNYTFDQFGSGMTVYRLLPDTNQICVCYGGDFLNGNIGYVNANDVFCI